VEAGGASSTSRGYRPSTVSPAIPLRAYIWILACRKWIGPVPQCGFDLVPGALLWFEPKASRSGNQLTVSFHLHGLGQTMPFGAIPHTALPGAFDWGKNIIPAREFLPDYEPPPNGHVGATLTLEVLSVVLTFRYFSARTTSKVSSGTPPCSNTNVGSSCQDEGSRLRGTDSDFDNPIGDRVREVVSAASFGKEADVDVLMDCPMNRPAIPAVPMSIIPETCRRERRSSTFPRLSAFREKVSTLFE